MTELPFDRYRKEATTAVKAVGRAAKLCRAVQQQIQPGVLEKDDRSPVTVADFGSQAVVCSVLQHTFPADPVVGEEDAAALREPQNEAILQQVVRRVRVLEPNADAPEVCAWIDRGNAVGDAPRFWTLDPIDGTKGFLRKDQYAVALAMVEEGEVVVAALACPNLQRRDGSRGAIFLAARGQGAWQLSADSEGALRQVLASPTKVPSEARFCESMESAHSSHSDAAAVADALGITAPPLRLDSQAKYAVVASGEADIYLRLPTRPGYVEKIWDHAAGMLVITEAGGRVTDVHGRPLSFRHGSRLEKNHGVVATNGHLHDAVLVAIEQEAALE